MKLIKRYANRRLYDTEKKAYITHAELTAMVNSGVEFKIIDASDGRDITPVVLGRILVEQMEEPHDIRDRLIELINKGGKKSMSILKNTYLASIGIFNLTKKKAEEIIDSLIKAGEISESKRKEAVLELLDRAEQSTAKIKEKVVKETSEVQSDISKIVDKFRLATKNDIEDINNKIDKIMKALEKPE